MSKLSEQLAILKRQYDKEYNPETAFGNVALIAIHDQMAEIHDILDKNFECDDCRGWGTTDCCECGQERECTWCDGKGLLPKDEE